VGDQSQRSRVWPPSGALNRRLKAGKALQEVELLKQQLKRSGDGGLFDFKLDEPKDIARSIVSNVTCYKAEAIHEALGAALKAEKKSHTGEANRRSEYQ
jgi:hypothetical protein